MVVSEVTGNNKCKRIEVTSMDEVAKLITSKTISASFFKEDYRNNKSFEGADFIMLDIDDGCTLQDAKEKFKEYEYSMATTKSHQKNKGGKVADRFRVVLKLEERITEAKDFYETFKYLSGKFPFLDEQCKDPSRQFYKSPGKPILNKGKTVPVKRWVEEKKEAPVHISGIKGQLTPLTTNFIINPPLNGGWNELLNKAVYDMRHKGYSKEESTSILLKATGVLDDEDRRVIDSNYEGDFNESLLEKNANPFNFQKIGDLLSSNEKLDWLVDGLLTRGGLSIIAGEPKSGKSTIVRQLTKCMVTGDQFLNREVVPGKVLYLALEEQPALLKEQFSRVGIKNEHDVTIHVGSVHGDKRFHYLKEYCLQTKPDLIIVDTLFLFMHFENGNDYTKVNEMMMQLRDVARATNSHIMTVHHTNKSEMVGTRSIMGSGAIHGAVDCAMIFAKYGATRSLTTSQRGGTAFDKQKLNFDQATETYTLRLENERSVNEF